MILSRDQVAEFHQEVAQASDVNELVDAAEKVVIALGFEHLVIAARWDVVGDLPIQVTGTNLSDEWNDLYDSHEFLQHDPIILRSLESIEPFGVDELELTHPKAIELRTISWDYGLCHGFVAPLRGALGKFGTMIFMRGADHPLPDHIADRAALLMEGQYHATKLLGRLFELLTPEFHEKVSGSKPFTEREMKVIHLKAGGLPDKTIAAKLNVSFGTIRLALGAIAMKMNNRSVTAALMRIAATEQIRLVEYPKTMRGGRLVTTRNREPRIRVRSAGDRIFPKKDS